MDCKRGLTANPELTVLMSAVAIVAVLFAVFVR